MGFEALYVRCEFAADMVPTSLAEPGQRYFAVGGLCDSSPYAELVQRVGLDELAEDIDAGGLVASYGATMADYNGADRAEMELRFVGAAGAPLGADDAAAVDAPAPSDDCRATVSGLLLVLVALVRRRR